MSPRPIVVRRAGVRAYWRCDYVVIPIGRSRVPIDARRRDRLAYRRSLSRRLRRTLDRALLELGIAFDGDEDGAHLVPLGEHDLLELTGLELRKQSV
jgi:hypothetical protein